MLMGGGFGYPEAFGLGIQNLVGAFGIEQHLTVVDLIQGGVRDVASELLPLTPEQITGQVVFRLSFDDDANLMTSSFSVDGGTTWTSPFAPVPVFGVHNYGRFALSADPGRFLAGSTSTTSTSSTTTTRTSSTSTSSTTTSSTIPACVADGCASLRDSDTAAYDLCAADATGASVLTLRLPSRGECGGCWRRSTVEALRYFSEASSAPGWLRLVLATVAGVA